MKYWSCCQRKTSEFQEFLDQEGCNIGVHKWIKEDTGSGAQVECRYDWHQTATHVVVAIYSKKYDPVVSYVEVNPIRLNVHIYFPLEKASLDLDTELRGVIDINECSCSMMGTKMEIKMKKAEPGSWARLEVPKQVIKSKQPETETKAEAEEPVDALDLDDLDFTPKKFQLSEAARTVKPNYT
jgi:cysteine/histidine-rich domain-containing protein